jgi:hypothetical protein
MSSRIQEWLQTKDVAAKSYDELRAENPHTNTQTYNEKILEPWMEQNRLENEIRRKMGAPPTWATDKEKIEFHRRQLALLEKANQAPRCGHVYSDGTRCRAPKLRQDKVCYAHARMLAVRPRRLNLPPLEDANAVMLWLMEVSRALLEGEITERTAGLLFYGLQMAMATARWTTFAQTKPEEMVRTMSEDRRNRGDRTSSPRSGKETGFELTEGAQPGAAVPHECESLTAESAQSPHQAKTGLAGDPGVAEKKGADGRDPQEEASLSARKPIVALKEAIRTLQQAVGAGSNAGVEPAKPLSTGG